jgi:hypothetical protein
MIIGNSGILKCSSFYLADEMNQLNLSFKKLRDYFTALLSFGE